jgi:hypothetical protein
MCEFYNSQWEINSNESTIGLLIEEDSVDIHLDIDNFESLEALDNILEVSMADANGGGKLLRVQDLLLRL